MTNLTDVTNDQLQALKDFASSENKVLVDKLEEILEDVAKTGQYIYPWHFMKPLYACKLDQVTTEFLSNSPPLSYDGSEDEEEINKLKEFREKLLQMFDKFVCAPFTIQRVSEMLTNPRKHYKSTAKFFRGLEKNIIVVSTIDPVPLDQRPVLKRSLHDENPVEKQNGCVDTELKPQMKKIHLEEKGSEEEVAKGDTSKDITVATPNITNENGTTEYNQTEPAPTIDSSREPSISTTTSIITPDTPPQTAHNDSLETMLVCTESVNGSDEGETTNNEVVDEDKKEDIAERDITEPIAESNIAETDSVDSNIADSNIEDSNVVEANIVEADSNIADTSTDIAETIAETNIAETNIAETNIAETNIAGTNIAETIAGTDITEEVKAKPIDEG